MLFHRRTKSVTQNYRGLIQKLLRASQMVLGSRGGSRGAIGAIAP